ncbi:CidA/LrgA family protein [Paenibacillus qinlingensis]|uniref:Holin-like protein n=1 Tax=Paenibacillus qinlingensis TaxID=1837343 RepID=A0ABU1NUD3_9BACL|nr:CidA/LrgA family protein [Paenibacillus qinlingensis]MDR6551088.1 holin-like protein [Paenibacillus qinlingensis]
MRGLAILLAFNMIGIWLQTSFHVPLPGNVIGLILFTIALFTKLIKLEWVETTANWLTGHMMLFFLPFVVGTMAFFPLIGQNWLSIGVGVIGSSVAVLLVTGLITSKLQRREDQAQRMPIGSSGQKTIEGGMK